MSTNIMAGNFILFIIIMHAVFSDSMSTASDELHNRNSDPSLSDSSRNYVLKHLLRNFFSRRVKRSPQWHQSLLVQGLSRPFCNLFGGNTGCTINPSSNVQSNSAQCAVGYRYDYSTQRCRQIQYGRKDDFPHPTYSGSCYFNDGLVSVFYWKNDFEFQ